VKGYLVGIIDRSNLRQKNHGRKMAAKAESRQQNRDSKITESRQQKNKNGYINRSVIDPQLQEEKCMVFICVVLNL
jgi:hypothetical protein